MKRTLTAVAAVSPRPFPRRLRLRRRRRDRLRRTRHRIRHAHRLLRRPLPAVRGFDEAAESGFNGFDIDLVQAIADGLDLELAVKDSGFDALQSGLALNAGQCDLAPAR